METRGVDVVGRKNTVKGNVKTCVITGYGINADLELVDAFRIAGSETDRVHIRDLIDSPGLIGAYHILAFPGGFSFGDHLGSGKVFSYMFRKSLMEEVKKFVDSGKLIIGICNGFQVLVKMGVLPDMEGDWSPEVSLIHNDSGVFEDSWVRVRYNPESRCVWTRGLSDMDLPIRHGEGKFVTLSDGVTGKLERENLVALRYSGRNPNGSLNDIAGVTDRTGRILGLMPHPEAFMYPEHHPNWTAGGITEGDGLRLFRNGVEYLEKKIRT